MNIGKSVKHVLKESTRLSSGVVFKAGTLQLGKTVVDVHIMESIIEKNQNLIEKIKRMRTHTMNNLRK